ncbi:MAG: M23 family metallopeptidase [Pseudomonadota bacterium]|nr:M23 family metallopeptidase [Pseudomonadota bacterium]
MKQELISTGLVLADFIHRHPKRIAAAIATLLMGAGGAAFAVASLAPVTPAEPLRLVSEPVDAPQLDAQALVLDTHSFTLYRSEQTRAADTPQALLHRLGLVDPAAAAFLRSNELTRQALFGRRTAGRTVTAEATERFALQSLRTHWVEKAGDDHFQRLVVEKDGDGFRVRVETAPLVATQRLASGIIRTSLFAATDEADLPDSVTKQLTDIFESNVDFHRGLRRGDRFSVVYETLEADGEPVRSGRILSAEVVNRGRTHQALWFQEKDAPKGAYYAFDGQSLRKAYLISPMEVSRITSGFGMRNHPVYGYSREHKGVDYAAPTGTPVRTVGDGVVSFAGVQGGYGNVIYIQHRNKRDTTVYAHLSRIGVKAGDNVIQGATIGAVGATGVATGPHLHFEFRTENEALDPAEILANQTENVPVSPDGRAAFAALATDMKTQLAAASQITQASFE